MRLRLAAANLLMVVAATALGDGVTRYDIRVGGQVIDSERPLAWMRCSLGQVYREGRCRGEAERLTLAEAEARVDAMATAECPWRLPRFFELRGLMQARDDGGMAIEDEIFPDTPAGWYWTQVSAGGHSQQDCFVDFGGQGRTRCNMAGQFLVRPVMDASAASPACLAR